MKQKFSISRGDEADQMIIQEYAELDKEILSQLCRESYAEEAVRAAMAKNIDALISLLRTRNFYPTRLAAEKISEGVALYLESGGPVDVMIDDAECLGTKEEACAVIEDMGEESPEIDDLLDDDDEMDDTYDENIDIDKLNPSIKIADDDSVDIEEDL